MKKESPFRLLGTSVTPAHEEAAGPGMLRPFRAEYGKTCRAGLLLHVGETLQWLAPDVLAAPWWSVC